MIQAPNNRGIILIEAIIAVAVLALVFSSAFALLTRSLSGVRETNEATVALFLAQDAVEYAYALTRYDALVGGRPWHSRLTLSCPSGSTNCGLDTTRRIKTYPAGYGRIQPCTSLNGCVLYMAPNGMYSHTSTGNVQTIYTRKVLVDGLPPYGGGYYDCCDSYGDSYWVTDLGGPQQLRVTVTVSWTSGGSPRSVSLVHNIYYGI